MTRPAVIVIAPTPYFSDRGCHIRIFEELKLIDQLGYRAELITYPLGRAIGHTPIHRTRSLPWYRKTTAGPTLSKVLLDIMMIPVAYRLAKQLRPKLIHAHLTESMIIAYWLKAWLHIPILLDVQSVLDIELYSYGGGWKLFAPLTKFYESWAIRKASHVIVSNEKAATILRQRYPHKPITVVADGVGDMYWTAVEKKYDIVYSGGLGKHKGTPQLITMLQQLPSKKILIIAADKMAIWKQQLPHLHWLDHVPYEQLLPTLAQAKIGIEPKPIDTTEGSAKELNYLAAGVVPARTQMAAAELLTNTELYRQSLAELPKRAQQHLWSNQLPVLKTVYESCQA